MIDELQLLQIIAADDHQQNEDMARRVAESIANTHTCPFGIEAEELKTIGPRIDFERWAGRPLTPSERIRHQQALRSLARAGLVSVHGRRATRARVTAAGIAKLTSALAAAAEPHADG